MHTKSLAVALGPIGIRLSVTLLLEESRFKWTRPRGPVHPPLPMGSEAGRTLQGFPLKPWSSGRSRSSQRLSVQRLGPSVSSFSLSVEGKELKRPYIYLNDPKVHTSPLPLVVMTIHWQVINTVISIPTGFDGEDFVGVSHL